MKADTSSVVGDYSYPVLRIGSCIGYSYIEGLLWGTIWTRSP